MSFDFQAVTKLYGDVIGVNEITMTLEPGAYGLLGPNGAGKSTLLNLITGQLRPTLGRVVVLGQRPWGSREIRRRLGYCPEADMLYPQASGFEFVRYMLELHGFSRAEAGERGRGALEGLGMGEALHRPIRTYSRGMRQRTKLAQALAHDPEVLVLDEPLNGLDPVGRYEVTQRLRGLVKSGKSLIMASHVLHEVQAVTDQFILIHGGRVLASGRASEIRELLADVPHQIELACDRPAELGRLLLDGDVVEGVALDSGRLRLATRRPAALYKALPRLVSEAGLEIREMTSPEENLETLFDHLVARR